MELGSPIEAALKQEAVQKNDTELEAFLIDMQTTSGSSHLPRWQTFDCSRAWSFSEFGVRNGSPKLCDEHELYQPGIGAN